MPQDYQLILIHKKEVGFVFDFISYQKTNFLIVVVNVKTQIKKINDNN